jgi:hypothetical protein
VRLFGEHDDGQDESGILGMACFWDQGASLNGILPIRPIIAVVIVPSASADYVIAPADFHTNASKKAVMAKI